MGIMTKAPIPGTTKTRLHQALTPIEAAELSSCFIKDTVRNATQVAASLEVDVFAVYTPAGSERIYDALLPSTCKRLLQRGSDLGERLQHAGEDFIALGYSGFCLVNSDSPTLPPTVLIDAVNRLQHRGHRVVLGPASDGGYYLIGLNAPQRRLFADITWSTSRVFSETLDRAAELGMAIELLPEWYDVDDAETLRRLQAECASDRPSTDGLTRYPAPETTAFLQRLSKREVRF